MVSHIGRITAVAGAAVLTCLALSPSAAAQKAQTVVYTADQDIDGQVELFAVDLGTLEVTKVNEPMVAGGNVYSLWQHVHVDRRGRHVFYIADADFDGIKELFHHDLKTGTTAKVNVPLVTGGDVQGGYRVDRRARTVVYSAEGELEHVDDLYRYDVASGTNAELGVQATDILVDRKGRRVFYVSKATDELWVTDLKKGGSRSLSGPMGDGATMGTVQFDARGKRAVYTADQTPGVREVHRVKVKKGEAETLNVELAPGVEVDSWFAMDAKARRVVYAVDDPETDGLDELHHAKKPGTSIRVSVDVGPTGCVHDDFVVGPRGRRVVYRAQLESGMPTDLYAATLKTGESVKLNAPLQAGGLVESFAVGPKGKRVAYTTYVENTRELYLVDLKSGDVAKLNGPLVEGGSVTDFAFGPKGRSLVYLADEDKQHRTELYHVDLKAGERTKLNPELVQGGRVMHDYRIGPRGKHVFYRASQEAVDVYELYAVELATGEVTKLSAPMVDGGYVRMFVVNGLRDQEEWL